MSNMFTEEEIDGKVESLNSAQIEVLQCCKITKHFNDADDLEWDTTILSQLDELGLVKFKQDRRERTRPGFDKWYSVVTYACLTPIGATVLSCIRQDSLDLAQHTINRAIDGGWS